MAEILTENILKTEQESKNKENGYENQQITAEKRTREIVVEKKTSNSAEKTLEYLLKEQIRKLKNKKPEIWENRLFDTKCIFSDDGLCYSTVENVASVITYEPEYILNGEPCCGTEKNKALCPIYQLLYKIDLSSHNHKNQEVSFKDFF